ncbi:unnamed protein product [Cylicocyclus nassatus]|uniref:Uncharacterized protein n=1 Tax=Cylicocyclus nassatus TaxID=53992 RepID=A0AA36GD70_CYLNA|nr:unnamed protein product [Cylicocyclus nassatus]
MYRRQDRILEKDDDVVNDLPRKNRKHGQIPISRSPSSVRTPSNKASTSGQYSASTSADETPTPITDIVRRLWEYREVRNAIEDYDKELFKKIANCIFR